MTRTRKKHVNLDGRRRFAAMTCPDSTFHYTSDKEISATAVSEMLCCSWRRVPPLS